MASQQSARPRDFKNRGTGKIENKDGSSGGYKDSLSSNLPKPNILRIEVLDGNARQRYLAAVQRAGDKAREAVYQQTTQPGERVFYGFLVSGSETGFNMNSNWETQTGSGAVLDSLKGIAGAVEGGNTIIAGGQRVLNSIGEIGGSLLGINKSTTGSGTVKDFTGVGLNDFHIKCGWYLPEQYHLCVKSLKTLYRMAYPKQTDISVVEDLMDYATEYVNDAVSNKIKKADEVNNGTGSPPGLVEEVITGGVDATASLIKTSAKFVMQVQEAFGSNYTFNPLPVRVSVGQYMDVEPLVIVDIKTSFSKETFINYSGKDPGRHLPLIVTTDIAFQYWLNPAPDLQFASILGQELFGTEPVPNKSKVKKESFESYNKRTNEGALVPPEYDNVDKLVKAAQANLPQFKSVSDLPPRAT